MKSWTETIEPICQAHAKKIITCDFIKQICDGSLHPDKFALFIAQDSIYLNAFKGSLLFLSERLNKKERNIFRQYIYSSTDIEIKIQEQLNKNFNWSKYATKTSIITNEYINFERIACSQSSIHVGLASLLPCFWLFFDVVCKIKQQSTKNNPFRLWIEAYSNPIFMSDITTYRRMCDYHATLLSNKHRMQMTTTFIQAAEYEFKFWKQIE